jgi:hypothetical protein
MTAVCKPGPEALRKRKSQTYRESDSGRTGVVASRYLWKGIAPSPIPATERPPAPATASTADQHTAGQQRTAQAEQREPATGDADQRQPADTRLNSQDAPVASGEKRAQATLPRPEESKRNWTPLRRRRQQSTSASTAPRSGHPQRGMAPAAVSLISEATVRPMPAIISASGTTTIRPRPGAVTAASSCWPPAAAQRSPPVPMTKHAGPAAAPGTTNERQDHHETETRPTRQRSTARWQTGLRTRQWPRRGIRRPGSWKLALGAHFQHSR